MKATGERAERCIGGPQNECNEFWGVGRDRNSEASEWQRSIFVVKR